MYTPFLVRAEVITLVLFEVKWSAVSEHNWHLHFNMQFHIIAFDALIFLTASG
jgi:hypothetical protein